MSKESKGYLIYQEDRSESALVECLLRRLDAYPILWEPDWWVKQICSRGAIGVSLKDGAQTRWWAESVVLTGGESWSGDFHALHQASQAGAMVSDPHRWEWAACLAGEPLNPQVILEGGAIRKNGEVLIQAGELVSREELALVVQTGQVQEEECVLDCSKIGDDQIEYTRWRAFKSGINLAIPQPLSLQWLGSRGGIVTEGGQTGVDGLYALGSIKDYVSAPFQLEAHLGDELSDAIAIGKHVQRGPLTRPPGIAIGNPLLVEEADRPAETVSFVDLTEKYSQPVSFPASWVLGEIHSRCLYLATHPEKNLEDQISHILKWLEGILPGVGVRPSWGGWAELRDAAHLSALIAALEAIQTA